MSTTFHIISAGPGVSLQDHGRPGLLGVGLSRSGAADPFALFEGAALLGRKTPDVALEMAGFGGTFGIEGAAIWIALSGAPFQAELDGSPLIWNAAHKIEPGQRLKIGGARAGVYGYLSLGAELQQPKILGSHSVHLRAGVGRALEVGDALAFEGAWEGRAQKLPVDPRFSGGPIRIVRSMQTDKFDAATLDRFRTTQFRRDPRANRMGVQLSFDGEGFTARGQLNVLSEVIVPGDIQMTGDGVPFVLMPECQTTGGYPRIATVLPCDLGKVAQAPIGAALNFEWVSTEQAHAAETAAAKTRAGLIGQVRPMIRDPHDIPDLLSYQLIGGVTAGEGET